jgi:hypothetical protein
MDKGGTEVAEEKRRGRGGGGERSAWRREAVLAEDIRPVARSRRLGCPRSRRRRVNVRSLGHSRPMPRSHFPTYLGSQRRAS